MTSNPERAIEEIISSFLYAIRNEIDNYTTKIYSTVVKAVNSDGTYTVTFNGKTHNLPLYGTNIPQVGKVVKVFVPQGNLNLAFIM